MDCDNYESIFYKEKEYFRNIIKYKNHPNIIIHGIQGVGKTHLIHDIIKGEFGELHDMGNEKLIIKSNKVCYYFNVSLILDKDYFINYIKDIVKSYDYYTDKLKYVFIDNYELININIQKIMKVIIEKNYKTTRFIIITNKIHSMDHAIKSRCLTMRISQPSYVDKYIYVKDYLISNGYDFNDYLLKEECRLYGIDVVIKKNICEEYVVHSDYMVDNIIELMYSPFNLDTIKNISSLIKELNINQHNLFKVFYNKITFIIGENNIDKCYLIIKEMCSSNHIIQFSYRDLIHIESLLIKLYLLINYGNV
jgi:DNA polymerase III delta prime subunit